MCISFKEQMTMELRCTSMLLCMCFLVVCERSAFLKDDNDSSVAWRRQLFFQPGVDGRRMMMMMMMMMMTWHV